MLEATTSAIIGPWMNVFLLLSHLAIAMRHAQWKNLTE